MQMEVIVGDFGIVVVPRDGTDTERIMNHSSVLRKHKVNPKFKLPIHRYAEAVRTVLQRIAVTISRIILAFA